MYIFYAYEEFHKFAGCWIPLEGCVYTNVWYHLMWHTYVKQSIVSKGYDQLKAATKLVLLMHLIYTIITTARSNCFNLSFCQSWNKHFVCQNIQILVYYQIIWANKSLEDDVLNLSHDKCIYGMYLNTATCISLQPVESIVGDFSCYAIGYYLDDRRHPMC